MAENAIIGALRVVLGADSASLEKDLGGAQSSFAAFAKGAGVALAAVAAAAAAAGVAIGASIKHAIDQADQMNKMSQKFGVPVEELSKLRLAADLSDVSMESLGKSMGKLSKNMAAVAGGADNDVARAFQAIGVAVTDANGKLRPTEQVLGDIAGKFKSYEDRAAKTALAIQLFGKAGAEMIPLLNSGKDGLADAAEEAEKFGIVLDSKTAKSAEAFNDNLTRLGKVKDGIVMRIMAGVVPAFEKLTNTFVETAKSEEFIKTVSAGISVALQVLATGAVAVSTAFSVMWTRISTVFTALKQAASLDFGAAVETLKAGNASAADAMQSAMTRIQTIWGEGLKATATASETEAPKIAAPVVQAATAAKNALDQWLLSQQKKQIAQQAEIASVDAYVGAKERMRVADEGVAIAKANDIALTDQVKAKIDAAAAAAELNAQKLKGLQLVQENRTPAENFQRDLENARLATQALGLDAEKTGEILTKVAERYGATWQQASESIAGSIQKIGSTFGKESKEMAMVAKVAGIVQSTISMFTGAAKALELPFPANLAAMASVLATGAGIVAQVRGVSTGGFQTGGSFTVPGGIGGGDKVMAMFEPGERVDVWRPGDPGADPRGQGGAPRTIEVRGVRPDDIFRGRDLLRILNEAISDGGRLKVVTA